MLKVLANIRIIPITIVAALVFLPVKLNSIWTGIDGMVEGVGMAKAEAQQARSTGEEAKPQDMAADGNAREEDPADNEDEIVEDEEEIDDEAEAAKMLANDPTLFTQQEIDLLQQLADRRQIIEEREAEINQRDGLLKAAEARINKKVQELRNLKETISSLMLQHDQQQEKKMGSLVKIYENMKPKDAARIFGELDMDTLLMVAERMKERKLAAVMAKMNPAKAKEMTVELARMRDMPLPGSEGG
ncbi:MAG: hypothetical protein OQK35_08505 [Alphaproteobacteria bacterium]|nr:hypothetical protein [Rhodospirillales bacterium]MCW9046360.1 hypothetical protein [Alphaproteobacteria bacterium]